MTRHAGAMLRFRNLDAPPSQVTARIVDEHGCELDRARLHLLEPYARGIWQPWWSDVVLTGHRLIVSVVSDSDDVGLDTWPDPLNYRDELLPGVIERVKERLRSEAIP